MANTPAPNLAVFLRAEQRASEKYAVQEKCRHSEKNAVMNESQLTNKVE